MQEFKISIIKVAFGFFQVKLQKSRKNIITVRFNSKFRNNYFVQCYVPTEVVLIEEKQQFYEQLNRIVEELPRSDIKIIMGGMNAKIGLDDKNLKNIMGKHDLGEIKKNLQIRWIVDSLKRRMAKSEIFLPNKVKETRAIATEADWASIKEDQDKK